MPMVAIVVENSPPRLRGRLSLLLLEIRAGTYVGMLSSRLRQSVWAIVEQHIEDGSAVMAWPSASSIAGIEFVATGPNRRAMITIDGLNLVQFAAAEAQTKLKSGEDSSPKYRVDFDGPDF